MNWRRILKGRIRRREPLKRHTTFRIGGAAELFVEPKDGDDLRSAILLAKKLRLPVFVIGAGSNLLVSDKGLKGMVIRLSSPYFNRLSVKDNCIEAGCGVWLGRFVFFARDRGLSGAEFLAGIPGTVGGALAMNAGIAKDKQSICELVKSVTVMDKRGRIKILKKESIMSAYRRSSLSKYIILGALFKLKKKGKKDIADKIKEYLGYRRMTQDLSLPSAGCVFRNPGADSAGRLIDMCGLKGRRSGGAAVSLKHANFILNSGSARCADVMRLMGIIVKKVNAKFRIKLTPEIKIWRN